MDKPQVDVTMNDVTVCGVRIKRPDSIAPSQWLYFWERLQDRNGNGDDKKGRWA